MKRVLLLAIALAAAAPAHAQHGHTETAANEILLRQAEVAPARLTALTGEKVSWRNVSIRKHTVTSPDGLFDSGEVGSNRSFSQAFAAPGDYAYFCRIHPSVKGVVAVRTAILSGPATAVRGETFTLSGRAAPGELPLLRDGRQAGLLTAGADGHFSTDLPADSTATWTAGGSDPVRVEVAARRTVALVRRSRRLHVSVSPPSPGGRVVLQQLRRERFGWWPIRSGRLGEDSTAVFKMPRRRAATRAVLTQADGATVLAVSNSWRPTRSR